MLNVASTQSSRRWARGGLILGIASSVAGNVTNTVLTKTDVGLALRIVEAALWPVLLFWAVEVLVRTLWPKSLLGLLGQGVLLLSGVPAAVTSFAHIRHLMIKSNEQGIVQLSAPLAIDALMIGCTIALLTMRTLQSAPAPVLQSAPAGSVAPSMDPALERERGPLPKRSPSVAELESMLLLPDAPERSAVESPAPAPAPERSSRSTLTDESAEKLALLLLQGRSAPEVASTLSLGESTVRRYVTALRLLRADRSADVSKYRLHPLAESAFRKESEAGQ